MNNSLWLVIVWIVGGLNLAPGWGQEKPDIQLPEVVIVGQEERVIQGEKSLVQLHTMPIGLRGEVETGNIAQVAPSTTADFTGPAAENPGCLTFPQVQSERDERLYRRSIGQFNDKNYPAAIEGFERLGNEYPASPYVGAAVFWSAEAAYQQGRNEAALALYEQVVTRHQRESLRDYALFRAAQIRLERRDYVEAANHLEVLLAIYPASPTTEQARYLFGETSFRAGQFQQAIRSLQTFLQRYPQSPLQERAELWRAESLYQLQHYQMAREAYQNLLQRFPQGTFALQARYGLAWAMLKAGEVKPARLLFQDLNLQTPDARYEEAVRYASFMADVLNEELDNAQRQWQQLQQRYPQGALVTAALSELAWAYFVRKDYAQALDYYQRLNQTTPMPERLQNIAQYMTGESFYQQGRFAEAAQAFRQIRSEAEVGLLEKAAFRFVLSLYHLKDFAQAIQVLQAFVVRYAASSYRDEVLFWLAESYFRQSDYRAA
ncbi:MAG: tetratricopeptide repeat protein, partial [bacterium]|nr:tetratricopeptide repeat protein [bacterium]